MGLQQAGHVHAGRKLQFAGGLGGDFRPKNLADVDGDKDRVFDGKHVADATVKLISYAQTSDVVAREADVGGAKLNKRRRPGGQPGKWQENILAADPRGDVVRVGGNRVNPQEIHRTAGIGPR